MNMPCTVFFHKHNCYTLFRSIAPAEEEQMFESGALGTGDAKTLQRTVWYCTAMRFGFRARDEARKLLFGDVQLLHDDECDLDYLTFSTERGTKTRSGQERGHHRSFCPRAYETKDERCPVQIYKSYVARRPQSMLQPDAPFYLALKVRFDPTESVWYQSRPLGKNEIGSFLSDAAICAGIEAGVKRITNHSGSKNHHRKASRRKCAWKLRRAAQRSQVNRVPYALQSGVGRASTADECHRRWSSAFLHRRYFYCYVGNICSGGIGFSVCISFSIIWWCKYCQLYLQCTY